MYAATNNLINALFFHAPVKCAWCKATGSVEETACPACNGQGNVMVLHPAIGCLACKGTGGSTKNPSSAVAVRCGVCAGSGWLRRDKR